MPSDMLERFRAAQAEEIARLRRLAEAGRMPAPRPGPRPGFAAALRKNGAPAVIAEYKRASPSRGEINLTRSPEEAGRMYAAGGAAAFSVLTERTYFRGDLRFLDALAGFGRPLLRKDFLLDPLQVAETAATPASALLVIARMFEGAAALAAMLDACRPYGLEAVCEVFDAADLDRARAAGASIIQVNNRDLDRLETRLDVSRNMARLMAPGELWISASGFARPEELAEMAELGYAAVLVGTHLMDRENPEEALRELAAVAARRRRPWASADSQ